MSIEAHDGWTAEAVRTLRTRLNLTQEDFAARVGVRTSTVSHWETGHTRPTRLAVRALDALRTAEC